MTKAMHLLEGADATQAEITLTIELGDEGDGRAHLGDRRWAIR